MSSIHREETKSEGKGPREILEESLPMIRLVRFKKVTFSFHIMDLDSIGIGEELAMLIRHFKYGFARPFEKLNLPKLVRIIVWREHPQAPETFGVFGGILPLLTPPYHISINTDNMRSAPAFTAAAKS